MAKAEPGGEKSGGESDRFPERQVRQLDPRFESAPAAVVNRPLKATHAGHSRNGSEALRRETSARTVIRTRRGQARTLAPR